MIFPKPYVMALGAFLFTSSASALYFENMALDRNGEHCEKFSGFSIEDMPQECVYHNFCNRKLNKATCTYDKSQNFHDKKALAALKPYCISEIICDPKFNEGHNSQEDYAKQDQSPDSFCTYAYEKLSQAPKECVYEEAFKLARSDPYFDESYHDKGDRSCDEFAYLMNQVPSKCLLYYVEYLDGKNPPPTQFQYAFRKDKKCGYLIARAEANPKCVFEHMAKSNNVKAVYADEYRSDFSCEADLRSYDEASKHQCAKKFYGYFEHLHPTPTGEGTENLAMEKPEEEKQEDKESDKAKNNEDDDEEDKDY